MDPGTDTPTPRRFRVAGWLVEADLNRISRDEAAVSVEPMVIEVLCCLAARPGELVSRDELLETVWRGRAVVDQVLTRAVGQLRSALGDDPHHPQVIETIARRGYRLLAPVEPMAGARSDARLSAWRRMPARTWAAALLLAAALVAVWVFWRFDRASALPVRTVTVLPFQMLSPTDWDAPLGEGMVEVLVTGLSGIEGLRVIARRSAFSDALEDLTLEEIGTRLGVDAVVQGSVQGYDDELRVDIRLVRTHDGQVLWSDVVWGDSGDLLALHEQAAAKVTAGVRGDPLQVRGSIATASPEAYREYLFGRHHWNRRTVDDLGKAVSRFETALELDPRYAQAQAALAQTYTLLPYYGIASPREAMPKARLAAERALELDPGLAEAHTALGGILHEYEWDPAGAEAAFERAITLDPSYATAHQLYAEFLLSRERIDEARRHADKALELEPLSPIVNVVSAGPDLLEGRYAKAAAVYRRTLEIEPRFAIAHMMLGVSQSWAGRPERAIQAFETALPDLGVGLVGPALGSAYATLGRDEEARALLDEVLAEAQVRYVPPYEVASLYAGLGNEEEALAWLERASAARDGRLQYLNIDRRFAPLREDPRLVDVRRRVGLPAPEH